MDVNRHKVTLSTEVESNWFCHRLTDGATLQEATGLFSVLH